MLFFNRHIGCMQSERLSLARGLRLNPSLLMVQTQVSWEPGQVTAIPEYSWCRSLPAKFPILGAEVIF